MRNVVQTNYSPTSEYSRVTRKNCKGEPKRLPAVDRTGHQRIEEQLSHWPSSLLVIVFDGLYGSQVEFSVALVLGFTTDRHVAYLDNRENPNSLLINGTRSENSRRLSTHMAYSPIYTFTLLYQNLVTVILAATICNVGKLAVTCLLGAGRPIFVRWRRCNKANYNLEYKQERFNAEC